MDGCGGQALAVGTAAPAPGEASETQGEVVPQGSLLLLVDVSGTTILAPVVLSFTGFFLCLLEVLTFGYNILALLKVARTIRRIPICTFHPRSPNVNIFYHTYLFSFSLSLFFFSEPLRRKLQIRCHLP